MAAPKSIICALHHLSLEEHGLLRFPVLPRRQNPQAGSELVKVSWLQPCFARVLINGAGCSSPRNPHSQTSRHKGSILQSIPPAPARCADEGADPPEGVREEQGLHCFLWVLQPRGPFGDLAWSVLEKIKCMGKGEARGVVSFGISHPGLLGLPNPPSAWMMLGGPRGQRAGTKGDVSACKLLTLPNPTAG